MQASAALVISLSMDSNPTVTAFFIPDQRHAHAVTPAWRWPVDVLSVELNAAGFDVVETHVRANAGELPQGAIIARRRDIR